MADTGGVSEPAPTGKKKRGFESAADMVRSLGLVLVIVVVAFFLAQPPESDKRAVRVVDPAGDIRSFAQVHPDVPVPTMTPTGWRATVADSGRDQLRVGWVTPAGTYVEYAASTAPAQEFVREFTGEAPEVGTVDVAGVAWAEHREAESTSLVLSAGGSTVIVGTLRSNASVADLRLLAGALTR